MSYPNVAATSSRQKEPRYHSIDSPESPPQANDRIGDSLSEYGNSRSNLTTAGRQAPTTVGLPSYPPRGDLYGQSNWDGVKTTMHDTNPYEPRNASNSQVRMASEDAPNNKFAKLYLTLLGASAATRWFLYIVPILGLLWIPGIFHYTVFPEATIWAVQLHWWSIWLSVWWGSWWVSFAFFLIFPGILRSTLGVVIRGLRKYIEWLSILHRYFALVVWALASWISFKPLVDNNNQESGVTPMTSSKTATTTIFKLLFGVLLCTAILCAEKILIQQIASYYHERSYAERLEQQRNHTRILITLYEHSTDQIGRSDTLHDTVSTMGKIPVDPKRFLKFAARGMRGVAKTTTQAFGNIASEIVGSSMLQPNSPQAIVVNALESANKTRLLARRLYYSFRAPDADCVVVTDIATFFPDSESAMEAFALFDKDANGDVTRDEIELACMEIHRERLALASSMLDIDSAVSRLDNILMSLYFAVAILVIAVTLDTELTLLLSGAGALLLALSWLIGGSAQEVLTSVIFLFVKHMYDVGDRVDIGKDSFVVKEIRLLSTIFIDTARGCQVQAPNVMLNGMMISNIRRSPPMSEPFEFEVAYSTTFEQIEQLRKRMLEFIKSERRDYMPTFDVVVQDIPGQSKMILKADIKYKSNWQQGALKVQRRNKWICALKISLKEVGIFGPDGDPSPQDKSKLRREPLEEPMTPHEYQFQDRNAIILDDSRDVYDESRELHMTNPRQERRVRMVGGNDLRGYAASASASQGRAGPQTGEEIIEMSHTPR